MVDMMDFKRTGCPTGPADPGTGSRTTKQGAFCESLIWRALTTPKLMKKGLAFALEPAKLEFAGIPNSYVYMFKTL